MGVCGVIGVSIWWDKIIIVNEMFEDNLGMFWFLIIIDIGYWLMKLDVNGLLSFIFLLFWFIEMKLMVVVVKEYISFVLLL